MSDSQLAISVKKIEKEKIKQLLQLGRSYSYIFSAVRQLLFIYLGNRREAFQYNVLLWSFKTSIF